METFDFEVTENNGITSVKVGGDLDLNNAMEFKTILDNLVKEDKKKLVIDCGKIDYIDSSGVGVFIKVKVLFKVEKTNNHKDLVLVNLSSGMRKALEITNLMEYFTIFDTADEAFQYFSN